MLCPIAFFRSRERHRAQFDCCRPDSKSLCSATSSLAALWRMRCVVLLFKLKCRFVCGIESSCICLCALGTIWLCFPQARQISLHCHQAEGFALLSVAITALGVLRNFLEATRLFGLLPPFHCCLPEFGTQAKLSVPTVKWPTTRSRLLVDATSLF